MHPLHVVTMVSNPVRFCSRYALYRKFAEHMKASGVNLLTVEVAFGERPFSITEPGNPQHVQLRTDCEIWHKENALNLGVARLPHDWKYVAWVDADVQFLRPDWAEETVHQLQHYSVVQMWENAVDMGPEGQTIQTFQGFGAAWFQGLPQVTATGPVSGYYYGGGTKARGAFWHPGYAWAMRRDAFEAVGGLMEHAILGAGDHHMALCMIGQPSDATPKGLHPNYYAKVKAWADRCARHVRGNMGYVPGTLLHSWHGKKKDRRYWDRWQILKSHRFDPETDIKRDFQGLWVLSDQGLRMRQDLQRYFRQRNEDSIDLA
jgi:hypothetical protein